jgi:NAD(P)-dependent dehydrogenase (short-subunit alcohol dehydrogenase family)
VSDAPRSAQSTNVDAGDTPEEQSYRPTAVIVGAGGALGGASAVALAERGFACLLTGPTPQSLQRTINAVRHVGGQAIAVPADASREPDVERIFATCLEQLGPCDVLLHAAAIQGPTAPLGEISLQEWESVLSVNLGSVFLCARAALRQMLPRRRGSIILVSSADALRGFPMTGPYAATKSALTGFARALSAEAREDGVRVNVLSPGPMPEAAIYQTAVAGIARETGLAAADVVASVTGARRSYAARDIARGVVFLATSDSAAMTGQSLVMDALITQV